ncbi:MAG: hypothetical protein EP312_07590 [Gammaproteobacteria bacterium]|nr:MAG: hypothetical protein EP312_07590 [Gammaproteobacteria bacterium]
MKRRAFRLLAFVLVVLVMAEVLLQLAGWYTRRQYQHDPVLLQPKTVRILCVGDSNVYGLYLPKEKSWPGQLQVLLDEQAPGQYQVINMGFPGTQTFKILLSLPKMLAATEPDHVIFLAGANDFLFGTTTINPDSLKAERPIRAFLLDHFQLPRLWSILTANSNARILNQHDDLQHTLEHIGHADLATGKALLAAMYQPFVDGSPGLQVIHTDTEFALHYRETVIPLMPVLETMRKTPDDIHALHKAYITPLFAIYQQTGIPLESHTPLSINGTAIDLDPNPARTTNTRKTIRENILMARDISQAHDASFLLLGYSSRQHFYHSANQVFRSMGSDGSMTFLDAESLTSPLCPDDACTTYFFPDQHPNEDGYRIVAQQLAQHFLDTIRQPPQRDLD